MTWLDLSLPDDRDWDPLRLEPHRAPAPLGPVWLRSLAVGAPPEGPADDPIVGATRLRDHRERVEPVLRMLDDVLTPTLGVFEARDFTLLLADRDGVVVDQRAGGAFAEAARRVRLQAGAVWDEATRGTNAIGTALHEQRPVAVHGAAHFARPNHGLVCYAAPIHDPWGDLVGVLDATSFLDRADPMTGVAVIAAARALEEALRLSALSGPAGGRALVERLLARLRDPALLISPTGLVTHANAPVLALDLPLGPVHSGSADVFRARGRVEDVLGLRPAELEAAARGQLRLPGLEVEVVEAPDGRTAAWLVVLLPRPISSARVRHDADPFAALVGSDPCLVAVRSHATQVAPSTLPVLIGGETGTGKELLARGLHAASSRAAGPFVAVNCGALTPSLLHSELFGYAGGAFTGADPAGREGRIASADRGTLFLDEVAEMPGPLQALLLRFLEDGTFHRVGDASERRADVRLVCATCRDLPALVAAGTFRADLFYRLRGVHLTLPPVRERTDLALLCRVLVEQLAQQLGLDRVPFLSASALAEVERGSWPGNVRELKMALHYALVMVGGARTLEPWHLPRPATPSAPARAAAPPSRALAETQAAAVERALAEAGGNVSAAARALGVARSTVYRLMKRHGLSG